MGADTPQPGAPPPEEKPKAAPKGQAGEAPQTPPAVPAKPEEPAVPPRSVPGPQDQAFGKPPPAIRPRSAGVTVEAAPKASLKSFLGDAFGLLKGMRVTFGYLKDPKRVVTREYPENRADLKLAERFRGQVVMPHDGNGDHTCTACTLCEKACPNGSINILTTKNIASKRVLGAFVYRLSTCTLCNLCIEACPFDAIRMGHGFEMASYSREPLELILNKKEGR